MYFKTIVFDGFRNVDTFSDLSIFLINIGGHLGFLAAILSLFFFVTCIGFLTYPVESNYVHNCFYMHLMNVRKAIRLKFIRAKVMQKRL